jgi:predicted permease
MGTLWQDIRYGFRQLLKGPGFTAVAVLSLALGLGANTAIFSLVNAILLRSLPVPNPQELRVLRWSGTDAKIGNFTGALYDDGANRSTGDAFPYPIYSQLREETRDLADVFGYKTLHGATVRGQREAFVAEGSMVSDNFFSGLSMRPQIGRLLTAEDDRDRATPAAVISHALWEREFSLDPAVLGQPLLVNGHGFTIVGVLPRGFAGVRPADEIAFYIPMSAQPQLQPDWPRTAEKRWWVQVMARLKPGASGTQLQAGADVVFARLVESVMQAPKMLVEDGRSGPAYDRNYYRKPLLLLLGVVGVVILVACANLAGLSLARGAAREHEYAVRAALGAGRWRLVRQSLVESLTLALAGAALGVLFALWGKAAISCLLAGSPDGLHYDTALDTTVLAFTLATALVTALLSGLLPAVRAGWVNPSSGLQMRGTLGSPRLRLGRALVAAQVALSLLLLTGAGLYGRSLLNLVRINPGFQMENLLLFQLNARDTGYRNERATAFYAQVQDALARIPGVRSAAVSQNALLGGWMSGGSFTLPGHPATGANRPRAHRLTVSEPFFVTMGIPILLGRGFTAADVEGAPKVVVVNETFARKYLAGGGSVGQSLRAGEFNGVPIDWQIVGVCGDAKYDNIKTGVPPTVYFSFRQDDLASTFFAVRTSLPPLALVPAVRQALATVDPSVPLASVTTQELMRDSKIGQEWLFAALCGALATLALLLCCIGLYGLMAYNVARRTGEIGIRMALGATPRHIAGPVLREALLLALIGVGAGAPAAFAAGRVIRSQLYGVAPYDPLVLIVAVAALVTVALTAAWLPARQAARIDPMVALRYE